MSDLRTSIVVDLAGNLDRRARQFTQNLGRFSATGRQYLGRLQRSTELLGRGVDRLGNRYTALLTGAAGIGALKYVASLETRMTRLGIAADISDDKVAELKKQIFEVANAPDIRIDPSKIITAVEEILERTGDLPFAIDNIRNIGLALQGTGATGEAIGGIFAEFEKTGIRTSKDVLQTMDTLNVQGKEGAYTFRNLADNGPAVVQAYAALGRKGPKAMRELGAALQIIEKGIGSADESATTFQRLLDTFSDPEKLKMLKAGGIQVFDPEQLKQGKQVLRPITELMAEITEKAKGRKTILAQLFDIRALRAFNVLAAEMQTNGSIQSINQFMNVVADGTVTLHDSARAASKAEASWQSVKTSLQGVADRTLLQPLTELTHSINSLEPERLDAIVDRFIKIGATVGAVVIGLKTVRLVAGTIGAVRGARGGGRRGIAGNALTAAAGGMTPVPVIIVGGSLGGVGGSIAGEIGGEIGGSRAGGYSAVKALGGLGARGGRFSRLLRGGGKLLGRFGGPLALLTSGLMLADTLTDDNKSTTAKIVDSGSIVGSTGGGLAGAAAGAAIGSVVPVIGTALGGIIGGILGAYGGEFVGRKSGEYLTAADIGREVAKSIEGKTDVNVKIDNQGRARVAGIQGNGRRNVIVDTGLMWSTP